MQPFSGKAELNARIKRGEGRINFGIKYLDDCTQGIFPADLILLGARSGAGKTQLCCEILDSCLSQNKKVLYIALEAELYEIETRLKYKIFMDVIRGRNIAIDFNRWILGEYVFKYAAEEQKALDIFAEKYEGGFVQYKADKYDVYDLIETVTYNADKVDLIILDHVHYFDFGDDAENKAIKDIAMTSRTLALENNKPIILVSHIRKGDKKHKELAPDLDEFHGSSELYKVATKVITIAPGKSTNTVGAFETFIRVPKNRFGGGSTHLVGKTYFDPKGDGYEEKYEVGWADKEEFIPLTGDAIPRWARQERDNPGPSKILYNYAPGPSIPYKDN